LCGGAERRNKLSRTRPPCKRGGVERRAASRDQYFGKGDKKGQERSRVRIRPSQTQAKETAARASKKKKKGARVRGKCGVSASERANNRKVGPTQACDDRGPHGAGRGELRTAARKGSLRKIDGGKRRRRKPAEDTSEQWGGIGCQSNYIPRHQKRYLDEGDSHLIFNE